MADEPEEDAEVTEAGGEEQDGEGGEGKKRFAGKTLILFIVLPAVLAIGTLAAVLVFDPLGLFSEEMVQTVDAEEPDKPVLFYEMPDMLVNLSHKDKRSHYLKLKVALEMSDRETKRSIEPMLPRIMDIFQIYLRELRSEDLEGSAGVYRLKEELLRRINLVLNPRKIDRILFKEMIVQ